MELFVFSIHVASGPLGTEVPRSTQYDVAAYYFAPSYLGSAFLFDEVVSVLLRFQKDTGYSGARRRMYKENIEILETRFPTKGKALSKALSKALLRSILGTKTPETRNDAMTSAEKKKKNWF